MHRAPRTLALTVIVGAAFGLIAAFALNLEKLGTSEGRAPTCNVNPLIGCGASLDSAQGALVGIPNPFIGIVCWTAVLTLGIVALAAPLPRWLWLALGVGITGAMALVVWFAVQSIMVLGVLCPWCLLTWAVTVPVFVAVWVFVVHARMLPAPRLVARAASVPGITVWVSLLLLAAIAVWAQMRLDVLSAF